MPNGSLLGSAGWERIQSNERENRSRSNHSNRRKRPRTVWLQLRSSTHRRCIFSFIHRHCSAKSLRPAEWSSIRSRTWERKRRKRMSMNRGDMLDWLKRKNLRQMRQDWKNSMTAGSFNTENQTNKKEPSIRRSLAESFPNNTWNILREIPIRFWKTKDFSETHLKAISSLALVLGFTRKSSTNFTLGKTIAHQQKD